jgi:hypothetical protein
MASENQGTNSVSNFGVTFVLNFIILAVFVTAFLFLRPKQKQTYQPRSIVETVRPSRRPRPLKSGILNWFSDLVTRKETEILQDAGLDGYFFLRYLRLTILISVVGIIVTWPVLLPVNATGGGGQYGFNQLSFTNVVNPNRYFAHALIAYFFFGFIIFTLYRELVFYIGVKHAVLTSPAYSTLVSSRTILISVVPRDFLDVEHLTEILDGVKYIWINRSLKKLDDKVKEREKLAIKIEAAENKLLTTAVKNKLKSEKKSSKQRIEGTDISVYVPDRKRPTHRLKPIIGKKVDTINYGCKTIPELTREIDDMRNNFDRFDKLNSVFVCFHTQEQAETAVQTLAHHQPLHMSPRYIGVRPEDIIWSNLRLFWWERLVRSLGASALFITIIIFWTIPVAFVGSISNIKSLTEKLPWLDFLNHIPNFIYGVISGFLPTILLALLMLLPPIIFRFLAKVSGVPTTVLVEYYVQNAFFGFQVVQVFLVTTLASGAAAVIQEIINDPSSAMRLLADNLPKASNFYISYFMLQGFTIAGSALLQIVALALFWILGSILDNTARKKWTRWNVLGSTGWGTVFPVYTNLTVIGITYSIISPLILAFVALAYGCIYVAYLHNLLFVVAPSEGRGIFYPRAIYQTFTGLYLAEVCLLGLFVVAKAWGPLVLMAALIVFTTFTQLALQKAFAPLLKNLPRDLLRQTANTVTTLSINGDANLTKRVTRQEKQENIIRDDSISSGPVPITSGSNLESGDRSHGNSLKGMSTLTRYFKPHLYLDPITIQNEFLTSRFHEPADELTVEDESGSYANPLLTSENPLVWIPRDPYGLSEIEVQKLREGQVNVSDEGAWIEVDKKHKKGEIKWGKPEAVPIWNKPVEY